MTDHWKSSPVQRTWKHIWIHGFVIGVGVVLIGFLVWLSSRKPPRHQPLVKARRPRRSRPRPVKALLPALRLLPRPRWILPRN